jgi:hypothetical protein
MSQVGRLPPDADWSGVNRGGATSNDRMGGPRPSNQIATPVSLTDWDDFFCKLKVDQRDRPVGVFDLPLQ